MILVGARVIDEARSATVLTIFHPLSSAKQAGIAARKFKRMYRVAGLIGKSVSRRAWCRDHMHLQTPPLPASTSRADMLRLNRSEVHTSALQSLMRISYAVLCLNKTTIRATTSTSLRIIIDTLLKRAHVTSK